MIEVDSVPAGPGCYLFKDSSNRIIYVGKAKNLKKRVKSYFKKNDLDPKTRSLIDVIREVDFIVTDNEVEALILENNLIKRYQPKYNIDLKDSKNYAYLNLTDEDYPSLLVARKKTGKGRLYGPFVSAQERDHVRYVLNKTFGFRKCRRMPKKACLREHIKLCSAPCSGKISREDYNKNVEKAGLILSGRTGELIKQMELEMKEVSLRNKFERALELREQIAAIKRLGESQKVDRQKQFNEDIINFVVGDGRVYLLLFNIHKGILRDKEEFSFDYSPDFFEEFLTQYYSLYDVPRELIIPQKVEEAVVDFLELKRKGKVRVTIPKRGEKIKLLQLVKKNVEISFFGDQSKLEALRETLGLEKTPYVIECFDISHLSGTSTVGSMVQFRNARPDKNGYRRFKIKTVEGIADTAAIGEVVRRRYYRLKKERTAYPDLVIIDGGAGQLNAALKALDGLDLEIPVIAIAKRFESLYIPGLVLPVRLDDRDPSLHFIREIRDEAHRFAIKYQRLLRGKELLR
jgi:excinuclease ABC subunit C